MWGMSYPRGPGRATNESQGDLPGSRRRRDRRQVRRRHFQVRGWRLHLAATPPPTGQPSHLLRPGDRPHQRQAAYWGAIRRHQRRIVWRSEDGGESWQTVFKSQQWVFNILTMGRSGTVYCPGSDLWKSADHGKTWKPLTHFKDQEAIVGLEADPRDSNILWLSKVAWSGAGAGGVYKSRDGGATWQDITGNLPYRKPPAFASTGRPPNCGPPVWACTRSRSSVSSGRDRERRSSTAAGRSTSWG